MMSRLNSGVTIGDDVWSRVGFVWDGESTILYIDDTEVAREASTEPKSSSEGLTIGAGSDLELDTFWAGLIDDVRIYDRVVKP